MQINPDCVRDIMLVAEKAPFGKFLRCRDLSSLLPNQYSENDIQYACLQLEQGKLLDVKVVNKNLPHSPPKAVLIRDITPEGHKFLDSIRKDTAWGKVKEFVKKNGVQSLPVLIQLVDQYLSPHIHT